jgi:tRNA(fMet)-specific endonuclease VapC
MYILDTNIISHFFRKHPNVVSKIALTDKSQIQTCSVVVAELLFGTRNHPAPLYGIQIEEDYNRFFEIVNIKNWDFNSAKKYVEIKTKLKKSGKIVGDFDMMIASIAITNDLTLVTNNTKDFSNIDGLNTEDWTL